jgi:hypothetical protein
MAGEVTISKTLRTEMNAFSFQRKEAKGFFPFASLLLCVFALNN